MRSVGIVWSQWGPYHFARLRGLCHAASRTTVHGIEFSNRTNTYPWIRDTCFTSLTTLFPGEIAERLPFSRTFLHMRRKLVELGIGVCLLPSYSPKHSLAALLAAKSIGVRTVMMNESHAGTARARALAKLMKRQLIRLFDAALVGGRPQMLYFASLGIPKEKIFIGYDAVDNDYFSSRAHEVRGRSSEFSARYGLPARYFLTLGRLVAKKNLATLIRAYHRFLSVSSQKGIDLVVVGAGEEEENLKKLCRQLRLTVYEKSLVCGNAAQLEQPNSHAKKHPPGVHFYGFRQIEENPVFYALAEAFILPSVREEWGLVVNEAMASGLPVIVSKSAGCCDDLLEPAPTPGCGQATEKARAQELGLVQNLRHNGLVFDPASSEELSRILTLVESSPNLRTAMGQAGRRVVSNFSCENFGRNALRAVEAALAPAS